MKWRTVRAVLLCLGLLSQPANADVLKQNDYVQFATALTDQVAIPAYERFAIETTLLSETLNATCANPTSERVQAVYARFHDTMDAWARVQPIQFGPVMDAPGPARFQFWPDKRGTGQRHLRTAFATSDPTALDPETLREKSIALSDLQALEYVLFDDTAAMEVPGSYACAFARTIADVQKTRTAVLLEQWTGSDGFRTQVTNAAEGTDAFFDEREAASAYLSSIIGALEIIRLQKLDRPLGLTPESARATRAESWRSARSLRNIVLNFETISALLMTDNGLIALSIKAQSSEDANAAAHLSHEIHDALGHLKQPLTELVADPDGRLELEGLLTLFRDLQGIIQERIARDIGLVPGFNATDGD